MKRLNSVGSKTNFLKNFSVHFKQVNWVNILLFYGSILLATYGARKLPNFISTTLTYFTGEYFPWNYNHGVAVLVISLLFYKFSKSKQEITLLGNNKGKALLFPVILFICYSIYGINNSYGIDKHLWAFIFCAMTFVYDIMEEYAWRGYLVESLSKVSLVIKSLISGTLWAIWHLLIFSDFDQYGGFGVFLIFCIAFSFILTFSSLRTQSIIVAAAIHALLIRTNIATLICFLIFAGLLLTWEKRNVLNIKDFLLN